MINIKKSFHKSSQEEWLKVAEGKKDQSQQRWLSKYQRTNHHTMTLIMFRHRITGRKGERADVTEAHKHGKNLIKYRVFLHKEVKMLSWPFSHDTCLKFAY